MEWQHRLISTYISVCSYMRQGLNSTVLRMSNNSEAPLTDEEVMTIYMNGIMTGRTNVKSIYNFTRDHLVCWFPNLGTYESLIRRLNRLENAFIGLADLLVENSEIPKNTTKKLIDSMPIILAKNSRSNQAKTAPELADKGYCASKKEFYYGVKLHVLGAIQPGSIPFPEFIGTSKASLSDRVAFDMIAPYLSDCEVFADKAYIGKEKNITLKSENNLQVTTPVKKAIGKKSLDSADRMYSTLVSKIRQPIESFFNWLQEKTGIQIASKVRSSRGLNIHIFGKIAAALAMLPNI